MNTDTTKRLSSVDVYRGLVMFLMLAEMLELRGLTKAFPGNSFIEWVSFHTSHVVWSGCSLHDLIQPGFSFLVGVALPFSVSSRISKGQSTFVMCLHAFWRGMLLVFLGIFLRSLGRSQTYFTFEDTLTQIGLGYFLLFAISLAPRWVHFAAIVVILVGYWGAFVAYPLPEKDFDYAAVGVGPEFTENKTGFEAHWNRNSNVAWAFDTWWMNLFPRERPFKSSRDNYATLSFIPTLATMLLGLVAGGWLKNVESTGPRLTRFAVAIVACLLSGWLIAQAGFCPIVKKIWTPTWVLWSGGWCFLFMASFHVICDLLGYTKWAFPLIVIGANSIAAYVMEWTMKDWIHDNLLRHFGEAPFTIFGKQFEENLIGLVTLVLIWLILFWLYQRKIFLKI